MEISYEDQYVAFIDVLGFKDLVTKQQNLAKLNDYFRFVKRYLSQQDGINRIAISDSIILTAPNSLADFRQLILSISQFQAALATIDIWIRGGVSFGPVYFDKADSIIVGSGFIDAFLLENEAKFPRVIIDPRILKKLAVSRYDFYLLMNGPESFKDNTGHLIHEYGMAARLTDDDTIFISYAQRILLKLSKNDEGELIKIYQFILRSLYSSQSTHEKYLWLKKYFRESVIEFHMHGPGNGAVKAIVGQHMVLFERL
jgi:hypothetical protein